MDNKPHALKSQEAFYARNKMGHLNFLSGQNVHAMFTYRKR